MNPIKNFIANTLGIGKGELVKNIGDVIDKFVQTPEEKQKASIELTKIINEHEQKMSETAVKELEIILKDNDSARNREVQIATSEQAPLLNKIVTPILALGVIILTFVLFYMVMFKSLGAEKDIVIYILGVLSAISTQIVSYYFGSSRGSDEKQKQINSMIK